jgi:hypothetical protein
MCPLSGLRCESAMRASMLIPGDVAHPFRNDLAHRFRDDVAHHSRMMSPTVPT